MAWGKPVAIRRAGVGTAGGSQAFVVFRAGRGYSAAPLASIRQIMACPANVAPVRCVGTALRGVASYDGAPLSLFDVAQSSMETGADRMILVVESAGACNGLVVDRLETIVRAVPQRRPGVTSGHFIHANFGDQARALTVCDLAAEIRSMTGHPAIH